MSKSQIFMAFVGVGFWALFITAMASPSKSHSWYPPACCNEKDCRKITLIRKTPKGMFFNDPMSKSTLFIGYTELRGIQVSTSPDGEYHVCTVVDENSEVYGMVRCFFQPKFMGY